MVTSVNTNVDALAAVAALNSISSQLASTQNQIETGLKVGSAADNAAVFTIAQGLRANINALTAVSDSLNTGVATLQGQSAGATSISNTLSTLLQTVTQAQNETGAALQASNQTIAAALKNIDAYAQATTINGVNLLASPSSVSVLSNVNGSNTVVTTATASTSAATFLGLAGLQVQSTGTGITLASTTTLVSPAAGDTATFTSAGGVSTTYTFAAAAGAVGSNIIAVGANATAAAANLATAINGTYGAGTVTSATGAVSIAAAGGGTLTSSNTASTYSNGVANGDTFTFTSSVPGSTAQTFTFKTTPAAANDVALSGSSNDVLNALAAKLQANGIAATNDNGQLTVVGGTTSLTLATPANGSDTTVTSGAASINLVNNAINQIGKVLSNLGSATIQLQGLQTFTGQLSNSVTTSVGALTDADLSAESAKLSSLQTKQSLAIQSLSLANQGPSSLLQLFR